MLESNALPRALDVAEFAAARVNEMKSLTFALSEASQGNRRAFQTLPKHLRRRTMSHDPKRIPRRLRGVAEREIAKDKNLEKQVELHAKRSRRIKRKAEKKASRLGNQEDREFKWLETHVWHAKRMKMENLWGFRMPMYPNDKGIRATNRASSIAAIHDASYLTCLQLSGTVNDIIRLMKHITNGSNVGNNMVLQGNRESTMIVYHPDQYPFGAIGPIKFMWKFTDKSVAEIGTMENTLWIWVHPAILSELQSVLDQLILNFSSVKLESLSGKLCRFQATGFCSQAVLSAALQTVGETYANTVWNSLKTLRTPSSLSAGVILGIDIIDPNVYSPRQPFAPNAKKVATNSLPLSTNQNDLLSMIKNWKNVACSKIWDENVRISCKLAASERKSKAFKNTDKTEACSVPILVIQNPGKFSSGAAAGYDIIVPAGWGMAVWLALSYSGGRVVGIRDITSFTLEQNALDFPFSYPDTFAGEELALMYSKIRQQKYDATPPSKRLNYNVFGVDSPFRCDWKSLFSNDIPLVQQVHNQDELLSADCNKKRKIILEEPVPKLARIVGNLFENSIFVLREQKLLDLFYFPMENSSLLELLADTDFSNETITSISTDFSRDFLSRALVRVSYNLFAGTPTDNASILVAPEELLKSVPKDISSVQLDTTNLTLELLGYSDSAFPSLHRGHGFATGFCSFFSLVKLQLSNLKSSRHQLLALYKSTNSRVGRLCKIEVCCEV